MAQKRYRQGPWPPRTDDQPTAFFLTGDGYLKSDRSLAGPLRNGTMPPVGPKGAARSGASDFGMDRISPRDFDPMGTCRNRFGVISSELVSKEIRRARRDD